MLTAKYKDTGEIIDITKFEYPRLQIDKSRLCCKLCGNTMSIKHGLVREKHFFHLQPCACDFERHGESLEHNLGKELIALSVKEHWAEYGEVEIQYEYPIPEIKRIADIAMLFPSGWLVVHEIQLSAITNEQLQQRTADYLSCGADVVWWLGKNADTPANRKWCIENFRYCNIIDYEYLQYETKSRAKRGT